MRFYVCNHCGNITTKLTDSGVPTYCCGEEMLELVANSTEAVMEKHKPVIIEEDGKKYAVVGSVEHPMTKEHHIEWLVVDYGAHQRIHHLNQNETPKVKLCSKCEVVDIYAYCNLHGLWKLDK